MTAPTAFPEVLDLAPVARVPGSKSITNRALLVAALADGMSEPTGTLGHKPSSPVAKKDHLFYYG